MHDVNHVVIALYIEISEISVSPWFLKVSKIQKNRFYEKKEVLGEIVFLSFSNFKYILHYFEFFINKFYLYKLLITLLIFFKPSCIELKIFFVLQGPQIVYNVNTAM